MKAPSSRVGIKYKSEKIRARRSRILHETRVLLSEVGFEGFTVRALWVRAGIAQKTLYNAFGSKENVIAAAIREFFVDFDSAIDYHFSASSLDGYLERLATTLAKFMEHRAFTAATSILYFSSPNGPIRETMQAMWAESLSPFLAAIEEKNGFAAGVSADGFVQVLSLTTFAMTTEWCLGAIADDDFIDRIAEASLMVIAGCSRGQLGADARRWLADVQQKHAGWIGLRKLAELNAPAAAALAP